MTPPSRCCGPIKAEDEPPPDHATLPALLLHISASHEVAGVLPSRDDRPPTAARAVVALALRSVLVGGERRLSALSNRYPEDLFHDRRRLHASDVRARGEAILDRELRRGKKEAIAVIAQSYGLTADAALQLLAACCAAIISAVARVRRRYRLSPSELIGVIKCCRPTVESGMPLLEAAWRRILAERNRTFAARLALGARRVIADRMARAKIGVERGSAAQKEVAGAGGRGRPSNSGASAEPSTLTAPDEFRIAVAMNVNRPIMMRIAHVRSA